MDSAWIGVVGGAVGVVRTLVGTIYTQRRADRQRNLDRAAETQRIESERQAQRDLAHQTYWDEQRRILYQRLLTRTFRWRDEMNALATTAEALEADAEKTGDSYDPDWLSDEAAAADLEEPAAELQDSIADLAFLASGEVMQLADALNRELTSCRRCLEAGDHRGAKSHITASSSSYSALMLAMRAEVGIPYSWEGQQPKQE